MRHRIVCLFALLVMLLAAAACSGQGMPAEAAVTGAVYYAIEGYTNGLLLVIAILLAAILFVVATKG
jgi:hypothetical protein